MKSSDTNTTPVGFSTQAVSQHHQGQVDVLWSSGFTDALGQGPNIAFVNGNAVKHGIESFQKVWTAVTPTQSNRGDFLLDARRDQQLPAPQDRF